MPRLPRLEYSNAIYHIITRGDGRRQLFHDDRHYERFTQGLIDEVSRSSWLVIAFCWMPNHWHLVVNPQEDGELSRFVGWLTLTHTQRWHAHRHSTGQGHVYQGRFKSFPIQDDDHFITVCRYVERNTLRANLVDNAQDWQWSSLWRWSQGTARDKQVLSPWPVRRSPNWINYVNEPQSKLELAAIRRSVKRGCPLGDEPWMSKIVTRLGLESTIRSHGRPKTKIKGS